MRSVPIVKVFISSPGDVKLERERAQWVITRLNGEFHDVVEFRPILYEEDVYTAQDGGVQAQIEEAADCEIVIAVFWGRLGTPLHDSFPSKMEGDRVYPSGTAYEVLTSVKRRRETGTRPDVYVFRKTAPQVMPKDRAKWAETQTQRDRLDQFFDEHFETSDGRILRALERFEKTDEFGEKVEKLLRKWIKNFVDQAVTWPVESKGTPFRGLKPFNFKQADVYFGRERKVQRALDELLAAKGRGKPFLLIPGASGAGKSSMMRAGLAPRIVRPGAVPEVDLWRIAVVRPGMEKSSPFFSLARALFFREDKDDKEDGGFGPALPELAEGSFRDPAQLARLMEADVSLAVDSIDAALDTISNQETESRSWDRPLKPNLLLLVDQLEEIFSESISEDQQTKFANLLLRLTEGRVREPDGPVVHRVWVIATLRGDMYEKMITKRPFIALKDHGGQYDLSPPGQEELEEIIHRSTRAADLSFEARRGRDKEGVEKEERLDDLLLQDSLGENTLPLLQFALEKIFKRCWESDQPKVLTFRAYEEIGGIDGAIERAAEDALSDLVKSGGLDLARARESVGNETSPGSLSAEEIAERVDREINPILESLLRELVVYVSRDQDRVDGSTDRALTSRMIPLSEARRKDSKTMGVIDALVAARLLMVTHASDRSLLGIAHDRVLVSWKRAQMLIKKNNNFYRVRDAVDQARRRWKDSENRDELLLPAGAPVAEAEEMLAQYEGELSDSMRLYIRKSVNRAKLWRRITVGLVGLFAGLAIAATGSAILADLNRRDAVVKTEITRDTIDQVIGGFSTNLRDEEGITVQLIEKMLSVAASSIEKLEKKGGKEDETEKIRANMHFEIGKLFQNATAERPLQRALTEAQASLKIRSDLASRPNATPSSKLDLANSFDQVGDILREMAKDLDRAKNPDAKDRFVESRSQFDKAYAIRIALFELDSNDLDRCFALSQSLIRLGDCKAFPDKNPGEAFKDYERALGLAAQSLTLRSDDVKYQREFTWPLSKVADMLRQTDGSKCVRLFELAVDIRHLLAKHDPGNTLWKRDLAFSMVRLSEPYADMGDLTNAEKALLRALALREELVAGDNKARRLWKNELSDGYKLAAEFMLRTNRPELAIGFFVLADDAPGGPRVSESLELAMTQRSGKKAVDAQLVEAAKTLIAQNLGEEAIFFQQCKAKAIEFETASQNRDAETFKDRLAAAQKRWERLMEELKSKEAPSLAVAIYKFVESPSPLAGSGSSTPAGQ